LNDVSPVGTLLQSSCAQDCLDRPAFPESFTFMPRRRSASS